MVCYPLCCGGLCGTCAICKVGEGDDCGVWEGYCLYPVVIKVCVGCGVCLAILYYLLLGEVARIIIGEGGSADGLLVEVVHNSV